MTTKEEYIENINSSELRFENEKMIYSRKPNNITPNHYNAEVDVIDFFKMHFGEEAMKNVHLFNIIKYATRFGKKDDESSEVNKIIHYAEMLKEIVENENK